MPIATKVKIGPQFRQYNEIVFYLYGYGYGVPIQSFFSSFDSSEGKKRSQQRPAQQAKLLNGTENEQCDNATKRDGRAASDSVYVLLIDEWFAI